MIPNDIEIVTVNYNTPDLLDKMISSVNAFEGKHPIRVIDGSDREPFISQALDVCGKYDNVTVEPQGWNIHHGRGLDLAITTSKRRFCLCMDTDTHLTRGGLFEYLDPAFKYVGFSCWVNVAGIMGLKDEDHPIKYMEPRFLMVDTEYYRGMRGVCRFITHGAPGLQVMHRLHVDGVVDSVTLSLNEIRGIRLQDFTEPLTRGTCGRFGYIDDSAKVSSQEYYANIDYVTGKMIIRP